jgi:hypothetical protein
MRVRSQKNLPTALHDAQVGRIVVDALIVRLEADLRWLDLCEGRLMTRSSSR